MGKLVYTDGDKTIEVEYTHVSEDTSKEEGEADRQPSQKPKKERKPNN